jgi:glycosyltransferase involved in cell wall biosynthesis
MRIAQVAPLYESVPPQLYGGTERVVQALTEELVRRSHEVTLFASGDSVTAARLVPVVDRSLRLHPEYIDPYPFQMIELGMVFDRASDFDLIHSHVDYYAFPFTRYVKTPVVTTLHGRLDLLELQPIYEQYPEVALISISQNQRRPLPRANWIATVYNGIRMEEFTLERRRGSYLAFLGRLSPEKGVETAVEVARRAGMQLKIAAKIDRVDRDYFESIRHLFDQPFVEYLGEVGQIGRDQFLGAAAALIFPVAWPEPFGLAMTEAMACGVPVIARRSGSVPEVIIDGKTGFICDSVLEMVLACRRIDEIDRGFCRQHVEQRFSAPVMADGYLAAYERLMRNREGRKKVPSLAVPVDGNGAEPDGHTAEVGAL